MSFNVDRHTFSLLTAVLALAAGAIGCNGNSGSATNGGGDSKVIKIYSSLPRTGSAKEQTDTIVNGIRMALEEANYKVGEFTIEYEDKDDATAAAGQWTADREAIVANEAVLDEDVMVYIGTFNSGAAKTALPILNRAGLLMISPANTAIGLTKPDPTEPGTPGIHRPTGKNNYFRVVPTDDLQGSYAADWALDMGVKKVYVLDDNEVYGRGIALVFAAHCEEIGIEVLGHESIDPKSLEFKSKMTSIKALDPDLIYFGGTTQSAGGQLAKDLVAAGLDAKFMVPDGCFEQAFIESAGAENLNDRCFLTFGGLPPEKLEGKGKEFVEKYVAKYGSQPQAYAVYGYEAAKAALEAIRLAGKKDRAAIVEGCKSIKDFEGALGTWSFDENGDTTMRVLSGNTVTDGKFEFVRLLGDSGGDEPKAE